MTLRELQLEGLVGPTHNYAGLGLGNVASATHKDSVANPRLAALQSLEKMKWLHEHGVPVAIMPPQTRPRFDVLSRLGIEGETAQMLQKAHDESPTLLRAIWSASSMWTANAATVSPSRDTADNRTHLTPANMLSTLHRVIECHETCHYLRQIFADENRFTVHAPLNVTATLPDEGAANHMRLCAPDNTESLHLFVYGFAFASQHYPAHFIPRHKRDASEAVAALHQLNPDNVIYLQQHPDAIDAGVFHHDVIGMSHRHLMICHENAFVDQAAKLAEIVQRAPWLSIRVIAQSELSLADAVATYFFNAQMVSLADGSIAILFPQECETHPQARALATRLQQEYPEISTIAYLPLRESMKNGGGPACLRLRIPLSDTELAAMHQPARFSIKTYQRLKALVESRYREIVAPDALLDPAFAEESLATQRQILDLMHLSPYHR